MVYMFHAKPRKRLRMLLGAATVLLMLSTTAVKGAVAPSPASAATGANVVLTGHDMDYHCYHDTLGTYAPECPYLKIVLDLVRNGSTLPVLALDQGPEVAGAIHNAYTTPISVTVVNPTTSAWTTLPLVDGSGHPLYSAIVTASDSTCGGCDNNPTGEAFINARAADIQAFFNAGGGILALAGAGNYATYYKFVPVAATAVTVTPPFTPTADVGAKLGITSAMANCCETHNSFQNPPSGSALQVAETDAAGFAETLIATGASISSGGGGFTGGGGVVAPPPPSSDPPITAAGTPITATEGQPYTGTVATITDPITTATTSDYSASINWGDGSPSSAGTISGSGGKFTVSGSHSYAEEGPYTATVTIADVDTISNTATATSRATVADAALTAKAACAATSTQSFNGPTATFTDAASPSGTLSDFSASINWGDGSSSAGTVSGSNGGPYTVSGSHTYASTGYFTVATTIKDVGGSTASTSCTTLVYAYAPGGGSFVIGNNNAAVGTAVTFWGAQWWKLNSLSGGSAPASFEGYAESPTTPAYGTGWSTDTGNSTPPPAGSLPAYMGVIVTSAAGQSGSTDSGNTVGIVVVKTDPGYQPAPGHPGTGTVVAQVR